MATVLYPSPIFGPIHSRRLGLSLGVNLMPKDGKLCTFDCIYCECGYNSLHQTHSKRPSREEVAEQLEKTLQEMVKDGKTPDVITFAGNGEPTTHPHFLEIIKDTIRLRDTYCPNSKISVLSNATMIHRKDVFEALQLVDNNILKLDTANIDYIKFVNRPLLWYDVNTQIKYMVRFNGHCIIQTMFMKGDVDGTSVDNTSPEYVRPWLDMLSIIEPSQVMVYTIDRETPEKGLRKASKEELDGIVEQVEKLGIHATASY